MKAKNTNLRYCREEHIHQDQEGHVACSGCAVALALKYLLRAIEGRVVFVLAPGCAIVILRSLGDNLSYKEESTPRIYAPFGLAGVYAAGINTALRLRGDTETEVIPFAGDGATFDIGLGSIAAIAERNEDIIYVCYDNEAYMNTGNQRSSASPWGVSTKTSLFPNLKLEPKKDIMTIMAGTNIPYATTATVAFPDDLMMKVRKAKSIRGFKFLHILTPCVSGWRYPSELTVEISRLAVETNVFPLYEIENGLIYTINKKTKGIPVGEYLQMQGRYRDLDLKQVPVFQKAIDRKWNRLQWLASYEGQ